MKAGAFPAAPSREDIMAKIHTLEPKTETQRWLRAQALQNANDLLKIRSLVLERMGSSIPAMFLFILGFWLTLIFLSFGLLAARNGTIVAVFFFCALSVAAAIFLILEMDGPFEGFIKVAGTPFQFALTCLGR